MYPIISGEWSKHIWSYSSSRRCFKVCVVRAVTSFSMAKRTATGNEAVALTDQLLGEPCGRGKPCPLNQGFPLPTVGFCSQSYATVHNCAWQNFLLPCSLNNALVSTHLTNYSQNWSISVLSMQSLLLTWLICTVNFPQVLATATFCSLPWLSSPVSYVLDMDRLSVVHIFPFCIWLKAIYLFSLPLGIDVVIWMLSLVIEPAWSSASVFLGAGL